MQLNQCKPEGKANRLAMKRETNRKELYIVGMI